MQKEADHGIRWHCAVPFSGPGAGPGPPAGGLRPGGTCTRARPRSPTGAPAPASTTVAPAAPAAPAPAAPAAPAAAPAPERPRYGGILTISSTANPASFDVQQENSILVFATVGAAYNGLVQYDPPTLKGIVPALAERWETSKDGLTYTFTLRKGVAFHNGSPLALADVLFSLERVLRPPRGIVSNLGYALADVSTVEGKGSDQVVVTLKASFAPLLSVLAHDSLSIYPR
ncbi:MAG: ABC transporter substrate-binding protein, partial [Chloroflexota bacterium]